MELVSDITYTEDDGSKSFVKQAEVSLNLDASQSLEIIEMMVKYLNKQNNELQQHIRTNKDKENQKIVDEIIKVFKEKTPLLLGKDVGLNEILNAIVHHSTGKDIKDL